MIEFELTTSLQEIGCRSVQIDVGNGCRSSLLFLSPDDGNALISTSILWFYFKWNILFARSYGWTDFYLSEI